MTRILREFLPAQYGAVLFGSRATGGARPGSDWDIMLDDRNRTTHAYDEAMSDEIYGHISNYHSALAGWLERLKQELEG